MPGRIYEFCHQILFFGIKLHSNSKNNHFEVHVLKLSPQLHPVAGQVIILYRAGDWNYDTNFHP